MFTILTHFYTYFIYTKLVRIDQPKHLLSFARSTALTSSSGLLVYHFLLFKLHLSYKEAFDLLTCFVHNKNKWYMVYLTRLIFHGCVVYLDIPIGFYQNILSKGVFSLLNAQ